MIKGFLSTPHSNGENDFEKIYISLRMKEGRILSDTEIARLPSISASSPLYKEWKLRKKSCHKLLHYLSANPQLSSILEVGCGNGWLSSKLATAADVEVLGIDINQVELRHAEKIFSLSKANLKFMYGDIRSEILADKKFDLIVFAASIQYFKSLKEIVNVALQHLTLQGEIHILDSIFYKMDEVSMAKKRSKKYFSDLGFPEMSGFYFHHGLHKLKPFNYSVIYNPQAWFNRLLHRGNPFYWISIKNHYH